ncbi:MAG TPA: protease complex subunit PrcB family protein [Candidatus Paceibacterota bacterium]|nr:protease complex subunit PrcB family protein [Candidatus Paceibacterota bacterium]
MRHSIIVLVLCILAILVGAYLFYTNTQGLGADTLEQSAQVANAPVESMPVAFTVIESGTSASDVTVRKNVAARDQEAYLRLYALARGGQELAPPPVDFNTEYVIGVFAGEKPTGGHMIEVTSIRDLGDTRTLSVTETVPGASCVVTQAFTAPYQLIRVPVSMHYLKAVDTRVASDCL